MNTQINIFEVLYPKYKIEKPIRLIEFFAGYGSQALALKYLDVNFQHWRICEWAIKSIQAYKDIHFTDYNFDYSKQFTEKEIKAFLYKKGISSNYNEPMSEEQIKRLNEKNARIIFNNIFTTNNLVNIQQIKGDDLGIVDKEKYDYIMTYSFPCQDLSVAGKGKGMSDTSTRSGMIWEVERILTECKKLDSLPQILLMENVPAIHDTNNVTNFNKWKLRLSQLGYKNYFQDLIATDYGIPQTRNRCFMISILGDYSYTFPKSIPLKLKLKDLLEEEVDEKYYLSDKQIKDIQNWNSYEKPLDNMEKIENSNISPTLTTRTSAYSSSIILVKNVSKRKEISNELIKNNKVKENDVLLTNFISRRIKENDFVKGNNISLTLDTSCDNLAVVNNLRIRKLTPKECFRLMGVKDEDFENCKKNQSNASLYHLAGDSICTNVLMALFSQLLDISWEDKLWNIKNFTKEVMSNDL